MKIVFQLILM